MDATDGLAERVRHLEDLQAIQTLIVDYGRHQDLADFEAYASLFAEDGSLDLPPG